VLEELASLQLGRGQKLSQQAQALYQAQQQANPGQQFQPPPTSKLGQALGQDPITQAVSTKVSTRVQEARTKYTTASSKAVATFRKLAKVRPDADSYFSLAQAAEHFRDDKVALSAYTKLLALEQDPATKARIRTKITSLKSSLKQAGG
jgi:hypothetical protein